MAYRYNLFSFAGRGEYWKFLISALEDDRQCFLADRSCLSGNAIKNGVSSGTFNGRQVLTPDYLENIPTMHSGFEDAAAEINGVVNKFFAGDSFSWISDTLPAIEKMQRLTDLYGPLLPDFGDLLALFKDALRHMRENDLYAFCDTLILARRYLQKYVDLVGRDIQCLREFGCFENA